MATVHPASKTRKWTAYYDTLFPDALVPPKRWEVEVSVYLFERRYSSDAARRVIDHVREHGSVEHSTELAYCHNDRDYIAALLETASEGDEGDCISR